MNKTSLFSRIHFPARYLLYIPLLLLSFIYLVPMYVILVTGFKGFDQVSLKTMWNLPVVLSFDNYVAAFDKLAPYMWNSINMVVPAAVISAVIGSLNGFVFARWKFRGANAIFPLILFGMFIPYQSIFIPLVQFMRAIGLYGGLPSLVLAHIIYGIPITTLIFRNYYATIPTEIMEAARIDGAVIL